MIKKGDDRKEHYKCKNCAMFAEEDADSAPYSFSLTCHRHTRLQCS